MDKTERLAHLIIRLNPDEKRLIKQLLKKKNQALALFDLIEKLQAPKPGVSPDSTFDEDKIIAQMKRAGVEPRNLRHVRAVLAEVIIEVLRKKHEARSKEQEIDTLIKEGEVLRDYGQYDWAIEKYEAAMKMADEYHFWKYSIGILDQLIILKMKRNTSISKELWPLTITMQERIEQQYYELQYGRLFRQQVLYHQGIKRSGLSEELHIAQLLSNTDLLKTFKGASMLSQSTFLICTENDALGEAKYNIMQQELQLWMDPNHAHLLQEHRRFFALRVRRVIAAAVKLKKFNDAAQYTSYFDRLIAQSDEEDAEFFKIKYSLTQFSLVNQRKFKEITELTPTIEAGLKRFVLKISPHEQLPFLYNQAVAHFFLEEFSKAAVICVKISKIKTDQRSDIVANAKLIQTICIAEIGNLEDCEKIIRAYKNMTIQPDSSDGDLSRAVVFYIGKYLMVASEVQYLHNKESKAKQMAILNDFDEWLTQQPHQQQEKEGFTEIHCWVKSRINKSSMQMEYNRIA
jgi:hypothetical protein